MSSCLLSNLSFRSWVSTKSESQVETKTDTNEEVRRFSKLYYVFRTSEEIKRVLEFPRLNCEKNDLLLVLSNDILLVLSNDILDVMNVSSLSKIDASCVSFILFLIMSCLITLNKCDLKEAREI